MISELYVNIGNIPVRMTGMESLQQIARSRAFAPFITPPCDAAADIHLDEEVEDSPYVLIHSFDFQKKASCNFGRNKNNFIFEMYAGNEVRLRMRYDWGKSCFISGCADRQLLHFALWMAFNLTGCQRECLCVHASCVIHQEAAVLFLGESGTGKSTQSKLWIQQFPGTELLNDDGPFIMKWQDTYHVSGSPWSGKTPCYRNLHYPIKSIIRVVRAKHNRMVPLSAIEKIIALLPSFPPALARQNEIQGLFLQFISDMINSIPVYKLECLPNPDAAMTAHHILFPEP